MARVKNRRVGQDVNGGRGENVGFLTDSDFFRWSLVGALALSRKIAAAVAV